MSRFESNDASDSSSPSKSKPLQKEEAVSAPIERTVVVEQTVQSIKLNFIENIELATESNGDDGNDKDDGSDMTALLEEACAELGYSLHALAIFLRSGDYPDELLALLKEKSKSKSLTSVRGKLESQRVAFLAKVEEVLRVIAAEKEAARRREEENQARLRRLEQEAREALERELAIAKSKKEEAEARQRQKEREEQLVRETEKEAARLKEAARHKEKIQTRLRRIGRCPQNFEWIPTSGGYRCAGGSHFVSAEQLNYMD